MKKIFLFSVFILLIFNNISAQVLTPSVISSGGNEVKNGNISLSFTIGELITPSFTNGNILTQGFEQPIINSEKIENSDINNNLKIKIYPNPTIDFVNLIITSNEKLNKIDIKIYDLLGKSYNSQILIENYENFAKVKINFADFSKGQYIVNVTINNKSNNTIKVSKN